MSGSAPLTSAPSAVQLKAREILRRVRGAVPKLHSTPPGFTADSGTASSTLLTNAYGTPQINLTDVTRITHLRGAPSAATGAAVGVLNVTNTASPAAQGWGVAFSTDAEAFELYLQNFAAAAVRIIFTDLVTGERGAVTLADQIVSPSGNGAANQFFKWSWGAGNGRPRLIEVYAGNSVYQLKGLNVGKHAGTTIANNPFKVWKPAIDETAVMVMGDSYTYGNGATGAGSTLQSLDGYAPTFGELMGCRGLVNSGDGGQGYLAASNSGANLKGVDRVSDILTYGAGGALDLFGCTFGINDAAQSITAANLQAAAQTLIGYALANQPNALVFATTGFQAPGIGRNATLTAAIKAGFDAAVAASPGGPARTRWIDQIGAPWQDVNATANNTTVQGNWLQYDSGDHGHFSSAGHAYLARRLYDGVIAWLRSIA